MTRKEARVTYKELLEKSKLPGKEFNDKVKAKLKVEVEKAKPSDYVDAARAVLAELSEPAPKVTVIRQGTAPELPVKTVSR